VLIACASSSTWATCCLSAGGTTLLASTLWVKAMGECRQGDHQAAKGELLEQLL
jgi:hypothetical protein